MNDAILARIQDGHLPMHFFRRADVAHLHNLTAAGYVTMTLGPLEPDRRTSATVTGLTPLGRAAIRYFGFQLGTARQRFSS